MNSNVALAYIGFGSNVGDRRNNILRALTLLTNRPDVRLEQVSGLYETQPVGFLEQADFLNGVVCVETALPPKQLLAACMKIEQALKRKRIIRWGPRTIDLDILLYDDVFVNTRELTIPHRELENRRFVLAPLVEIAPKVNVPNSKKTVERLLLETKDVSRIDLLIESTEVLSMIKKV